MNISETYNSIPVDPSLIEKLLEREERLTSALKAGNVGTWQWDIINRQLTWSEVTERLHGLAPGAFRGTQEHFISLMLPEDVEPCMTAIRATIATGGAHTHEYRVHLEDGSIRWLQGQGRVVQDSAGVRIRLVGTITEITDRKDREKAEQELRSANRRLQSHLENTPLAVIEWDADGQITHWAQSAEQMFGWTEAQAVGKTSTELGIVHEEDAELVKSITIAAVQNSKSKVPVKNRNYAADDRVLECEWYNSVLIDELGEPAGLLSLVHDVTDRNRIERQFIESQKMEVLGRLAGGIAHDYNNLLAVILGYADILEEGLEDFDATDGPESLLQPVKNIAAAATRAADLTRQLLAFARKQVAQPKVVNPAEVIEGLANMISPLLGADVECVMMLNEHAGNVRIDTGQLEQVLMNLAVNARDAMPDGGNVSITLDNIRIEQTIQNDTTVLTPGDYVVIGVSDTGTGMSPEVQRKVFEPFFTTKPVGKGTGLGLATCFGIVKQSGGEITIESEPQVGTTFRVFLPRVSDALMKDAPESYELDMAGSETLLLVDDDSMVRHLHAGVLSRYGYRVIEAENGIHALKALGDHYPDVQVIISDAMMPQMGGKELAERVHELYPYLPIIIASGYSEFTNQNLQSEAVTSFLQKPFSARTLVKTVRSVLDLRAAKVAKAVSPPLGL